MKLCWSTQKKKKNMLWQPITAWARVIMIKWLIRLITLVLWRKTGRECWAWKWASGGGEAKSPRPKTFRALLISTLLSPAAADGESHGKKREGGKRGRTSTCRMALRRALGWSDGELMRSDAKPCSRMMRHTAGIFSVGGALGFWVLCRLHYGPSLLFPFSSFFHIFLKFCFLSVSTQSSIFDCKCLSFFFSSWFLLSFEEWIVHVICLSRDRC